MKAKVKVPFTTIKTVAERLKVSRTLVSNVLSGMESSRRAAILTATAEYLKEYKAREKEAEAALADAMKD